MERTASKIIKIHTHKLRPIYITEEHPIATLSDKNVALFEDNINYVCAKNIEKGDYLLVPRLETNENTQESFIFDKKEA